jgi:pyruvate dehydrogenase E1 component beta subunit
MDYDTILTSVKKKKQLVVLEEAWPLQVFASEITYIVQERAFDFLDAPIQRITLLTLQRLILQSIERMVA